VPASAEPDEAGLYHLQRVAERALLVYAVGKDVLLVHMVAVTADRFPRTGGSRDLCLGGTRNDVSRNIGTPVLLCKRSIHRRGLKEKESPPLYENIAPKHDQSVLFFRHASITQKAREVQWNSLECAA